MKGTRAALRYAKATLDLAKDKGILEEVNNDMLLIDHTFTENHDLQIMVKSPIIKSSLKKSTLTKIYDKKINPVTQGVINLLIENKRIDILQLVAKEFTIIYDFFKGTEIAQVTTAIPLTKELEKKILIKIKDIVGKEISLNNIVDPSIVGGYILRVGDKQLDSSVTGLLNSVREEFDDNHYISKL